MPTAIPLIPLECADISVPTGVCITFPGGAQICAQNGQLVASKFEVVKQLFAQLNAALAPLKPFFDLLNLVIAIKDATSAIPDAITSLSPTKVIDALVDVVKAVEPVLRIVPQLSVPFMILDIIDAILLFLEGLAEELQKLVDQQVRIAAARARAAEDTRNAQLSLVADCAQGLLEVQVASLNQHVQPLNQLVTLINILVELVGLDPLPTLNDLDTDITSSLAGLDVVAQTLRELRDKIPV